MVYRWVCHISKVKVPVKVRDRPGGGDKGKVPYILIYHDPDTREV